MGSMFPDECREQTLQDTIRHIYNYYINNDVISTMKYDIHCHITQNRRVRVNLLHFPL